MYIIQAEQEDLSAILGLQKLAYQSEARLLGTDDIPPLQQTLAEVIEEFQTGLILKGLYGRKIIGSIRGRSDGHTCYVGKLMVSPEHQGHGYGSQLLLEIEKVWPHQRYELFTSTQSSKNIKLYEKTGYRIFEEKQVRPDLCFVFLEKCLRQKS